MRFCHVQPHVWTRRVLICYSVAQSCLTPCNCRMPGFPVLHHLPEIAQTHVHLVSDAIEWSHPVISFSSCFQSFPASAYFLMRHLFASGKQNIRASASVLVLIINIQDWFPLGLTGLISLQSKGLSKRLLQHHSSKVSILRGLSFLWTNSHIHTWLPEKP